MNVTNIDLSVQLLRDSFGTTGVVWWVIGFIVGVFLSTLVFNFMLSQKNIRIKELSDKNDRLERRNNELTGGMEREVVYVRPIELQRREPTASLVIASAIPLGVVSG